MSASGPLEAGGWSSVLLVGNTRLRADSVRRGESAHSALLAALLAEARLAYAAPAYTPQHVSEFLTRRNGCRADIDGHSRAVGLLEVFVLPRQCRASPVVSCFWGDPG